MQPDYVRTFSELLELAEATERAAATIVDATIRARLREIAIEVRNMARGHIGSLDRECSHPMKDWDTPGMRPLA